jgi:hypothetical protein
VSCTISQIRKALGEYTIEQRLRILGVWHEEPRLFTFVCRVDGLVLGDDLDGVYNTRNVYKWANSVYECPRSVYKGGFAVFF